jgi:hypothetical protein
MITGVGRTLFDYIGGWISIRAGHPPVPQTRVAFDHQRVSLHNRPATGGATSFLWQDVTRMCFRSGQHEMTEGFYVLTDGGADDGERCFIIPLEAGGCARFFEAARARGLFPDDLAILALTATKPAWYCWPPDTGTPSCPPAPPSLET